MLAPSPLVMSQIHALAPAEPPAAQITQRKGGGPSMHANTDPRRHVMHLPRNACCVKGARSMGSAAQKALQRLSMPTLPGRGRLASGMRVPWQRQQRMGPLAQRQPSAASQTAQAQSSAECCGQHGRHQRNIAEQPHWLQTPAHSPLLPPGPTPSHWVSGRARAAWATPAQR